MNKKLVVMMRVLAAQAKNLNIVMANCHKA
jgi:hypothetical protein